MNQGEKKFYIIDGSGFLYRAYYAFPKLTNEKGEDINAIYGFFRMLFKVFLDKPEYLVIARDSPVKTIRHEMFAEYKANRTKAPDEFKRQIPLIHDLVEKLGISSIRIPGYEADDIIGTLVNKYKQDKNQLCGIMSSDKDLKQLLDDNVVFLDPMKEDKLDMHSFKTEFGFEPKAIIEYLSLTGDSSDNIPGVVGIGPKKATELILKYGDLDGIYAHLDEISEETKNKLLTGKENAYYSKKLIQLMEVPGLGNSEIKDFSLNINFEKYKEILVNDCHFTSFGKVIQELKNKLQAPVQMGLF